MDYKRRGVALARNQADRMAKGKYIAVLDDDDVWIDRGKLRKQVEFLENNPEYVCCGGGVKVIIDEGQLFYQRIFPETDEQIRKNMLIRDIFVHSSLVFRRGVEKYDEKNRMCDDLNLYFRLGIKGKLYNFPEYFVKFLLGNQNKPSRTIYVRKIYRENMRLMWKHRKDYPHIWLGLLVNLKNYAKSFL